MKRLLLMYVIFGALTLALAAQETPSEYGNITEKTPSIGQYFSWINNTNEGSTEQQTLVNLAFFKWLHDEYGMHLGIYAWDAGNIDSAQYYGSMQTEKFKRQYPNGWKAIADKAASFGCRLGLWGGPDGFGNTPKEEKARTDLLVSLCRDYGLQLFKFDAVCGNLRDEKQDAFARAMTACRTYAPDLIVLNHRLNLGKALRHATTFLWGGAETYIDVHMVNSVTAPHNRAAALSRGLPPELKRLTEDHGVCISSCLDFWEDDLVLQAFNRGLILAPEIYGNPWLLRDDEFPKLARLYNLHFRNRDILVEGTVLPEARYGPHAVARGDAGTRFVTLRNLTWNPVTYDVRLDQEIGLTEPGTVQVRRYHPSEYVYGTFDPGDTLSIEVAPFRSCLLMATVRPCPEIGVLGCDYEVVRDTHDKPVLLKLLGRSGETATVTCLPGTRSLSKAFLEGQRRDGLLGRGETIRFSGRRSALPTHHKLAALTSVPVPDDAEACYEATCFSAQNTALEVQSLRRSGPTQIPQVQAARDAFFDQELFWRRGIWDRYMFDNNPETFFSAYHYRTDKRLDGGALRLDLGKSVRADSLTLTSLWPLDRQGEAPTEMAGEVSQDRVHWQPVILTRDLAREADYSTVQVADIRHNGGEFSLYGTRVQAWAARVSQAGAFRYVRVPSAPDRIAEISVWKDGQPMDRSQWQATNLFAPYQAVPAQAAWQASLHIENDVAANSVLCVALEGRHGTDKTSVALRMDDEWIGASQRAPSFPCVAWEYGPGRRDRNNTYYFPVTDAMRGKALDVVVLSLKGGLTEF
ncbi:MAG: hypothetical protein K9N55_19725, partial [Phycisphaerae bacterium]|nr:hypothetical protein [Phycisphaerae bacterium]